MAVPKQPQLLVSPQEEEEKRQHQMIINNGKILEHQHQQQQQKKEFPKIEEEKIEVENPSTFKVSNKPNQLV